MKNGMNARVLGNPATLERTQQNWVGCAVNGFDAGSRF